MRKWLSLSVVGVLFLLLALPALAVVPVSQNETYEIRIPEFDSFGSASLGAAAGRQVEESLSLRYGGAWRVHSWNTPTQTPRWVYGTAPQLTRSIVDAGNVEQLARQVIADNADVLGADLSNLKLEVTPNAAGKWAVHYQQTFQGLDVDGAKVITVFSEDGKLMLMGSTYHRDIEISTAPTLSASAATNVALSDMPYNPATDRVMDEPVLKIVSVPLSEIEIEHHLVWSLRIRTEEPFGLWATLVDAHDGEILERQNEICFNYFGTTAMPVHVNTYCDGVQQIPSPYMDVVVGSLGTVTTDANGAWNIAGSSGDQTVTARMTGPVVRLQNYNGAEAQFTGTAHVNQSLPIIFTDQNSRADERDTFEAMSRTYAFFQTFAPGFAYMHTQHPSYVNRSDGYCPGNAWWDPSDNSTNFCAGSSQYGNTGEMQQVAEHELGHGIQDAILGGTQGDQGLGEGNGDIIGNLITQDPIIGRGFYVGNCVSGIRNSLNTLRYPGDVIGIPIHTAGQVIAGFNWDSMVLLQGQYGMTEGTRKSAERWHNGRVLLRPMVQPDQVLATFVADDDNGNLGDGTPNHALFCQAAGNHGFSCPEILVGVFVYHDVIPYQSAPSGYYDVVCTAASLGGGTIVPGSLTIHYQVNGGSLLTVPMSVEGDHFRGLLPAQAYGSVVEYYISALNTLGAEGFSPRNAPDELHYFQVDNSFEDDMEIQTSWKIGAVGDNASAGLWERGDPQPTNYNGTPVQTGDDHTPAPGINCYATGLAAGSAAGSNDVDGGSTSLLSPVFDLNGGTDVSISYWRWYTNNAGNSPDQDYWTVQVSNDGGVNWTNVEHTTTSNTAWQQVVINLVDYFPVPDLVQVKFIADDTAPGSLVEAAVDDFTLVGTFDLTGVDDEPGLALAFDLKQNQPNPFNPRTTVSFALNQRGPASLKVFDAEGRLVKVLVDANLEAGPHQAVWEGNDASGRPVSSGVYFYRLEAAGRTFSKRMLLVK